MTKLILSKGDYAVAAQDIIDTLSGGNILKLLSNDETDTVDTIAAAGTIEKSYSLGVNSYSQIMVEAEIEISYTILSTLQPIAVEIFDGVTSKKTFTMESLAATGRSGITIKTAFIETTAQTISIKQHGTTAADTHTTIIVHSLRVYAIL